MSEVLHQIRKKIDRLTVAGLARLFLLISRILPYRLGVWIGGRLGAAAYHLLPRDRKRAGEHLRRAFPDNNTAWISATARMSFIHLGKCMLEMMLTTPQQLAKRTSIVGYQNLKRAHDQGRGVIYVTGHIGNWELQGALVASKFPLSVVAAPLEPEVVNDMVLDLRQRHGMSVILRGRPGASRELIRIFRENRILGLLIDQDTDVDGAFVDFMGSPAWTPTAAASMALKFNAPVVFGYARREADGRHRITIEGPLELIRTGNEENDIISNTAMFTKMLESSIRTEPTQWVWMHRRWRRQP